MAFPTDYTLLGTLTAPSITGSNPDVPLRIKFEDFTTEMLASLDTGGGDLRLSHDAAGSSQIALEIVSFNKSAGGIQVWYTEPTAETGQIIYVWGDNTGDAKEGDTATYGRNAVWSDYGFASHDGGATDSTGNHTPTLNGGIVGGDTTGAIGVATDFSGSEYIEVGNSTDLNTVEGTIQAIVSINALPSVSNTFYNVVNRQNSIYGTELLGIPNTSDKLLYRVRKSGGANNDLFSATTLEIGQFYWCYGSYDATTDEQTLYLDTATPVTGTITDAIDTANAGAWTIGARGDNTSRLNGVLDEVRRTGLVLSTNQILLEISNQSATTAWFTAANAVGGGGPLTALPTGIISAEAFGDAAVILSTVVITTTSIESAEAFGLPSRQLQNTLTAVSISSTEAVGEPSLSQTQFVTPTSIASTAQVGAAQILAQTTLVTSSILSTEIVGDPYLMYNQVLTLTGINSTETFGFTRLRDETAIPLATMYRAVMGNVYRDVIGEVYDIRT